MKRKDFDSLIDRAAFRELFVTEMGWNNPDNSQPLYITIDEQPFDFMPVADKQGFHVYTCDMDILPTAAECKKIDNKLRNYGYDYICIFVQTGTAHHLWLTPVKNNEKRELVKTEYNGGGKADFLFSKIDDLTFGLTERVLITDVKNRVQGSFHLNSEKITKEFYTQFRKEHTAFKKHIVGIDDEKNKDWYASVMLNRLMFCYFIQKKRFLDLNANYLQDKLKWVRQQQGENQFFGTFYKGFLCALFHEGLNNPSHDTNEFIAKYGRIPYLNGGLFDNHQIEREHKGIDIADIAFENLFNFFDKWNWHLDTRLTASGKDINPDVLGYIFEQYINDRASMGAYYTKEDITEYIGKNCIIPYLFDKTAEKSSTAFRQHGEVWTLLKQSGDKYIYDAVKKGYSPDWQKKIPEYISKGIDTSFGNLLERRSRWNEKTLEDFALPTEIWRETIERLQRCDTLLQKISNGEIQHINDFITYNLDIRQFTEDIIRLTDDHKLVAHFYHNLQNITILDPTCGSGAFLFAALNILEPLYEACLDRMEEFHRKNRNLFGLELEEINTRYNSNRQYFIYKSIILRNLYGVDIMVEATEIAKLRLFLKMVAVVDVDKRKDNLGLDPLPDIDFNIKCGNTLVGYATEKQLHKALVYGDMFANKEFKDKISTEMNVVATAYSCFRSEQLKTYDDNASIKATKEMLKSRLVNLNDSLNLLMYKSDTDGNFDYNIWKRNTQPFHWIAEYYQIKGNGGFDVIIGNPPYVEYNKKDKETKKAISNLYRIEGYKTEECGNLYAFVIERCNWILNDAGKTGMIIPHSSICTDRMSSLYNIFKKCGGWYSTYDTRPAKLFDGVDQRILIYILGDGNSTYTTQYYHWYTEYRPVLLSTIEYTNGLFFDDYVSLSKVTNRQQRSILDKTLANDKLVKLYNKQSGHRIFYHGAPRYFTRGTTFAPYFYNEKDGEKLSVSIRSISFESKSNAKIASCILCSSLFFFWFVSTSDCRHLNSREVDNFPYSQSHDNLFTSEMSELCDKLMNDFEKNKYRKNTYYKATGQVVYDEYYPKLSKPVIDEIDKVLAKHYGFTEEELDFIINYDIKYRMGDELENIDE